MRTSASVSDAFPLLGGLLEGMAATVEANPRLKAALEAAAADRLEDMRHALTYPTNPWVALATADELAGMDPRGAYRGARKNTVILSRALAEDLAEGGGPATTAATVAILRGLVHWLARTDWTDADQEPGKAFEAAVAAGVVPPVHEAEGPAPVPVEPDEPEEEPAVAYRLGAAILDIAGRHLGQPYAFTPTPDYDDPNWQGPFDCAEYASYSAWRAYRIAYGVVRDPVKRFNSYSGYWRRDAERLGIRIAWRDALHIPGAVLLRYPPRGEPPPYGHVAISLGDGGGTYEALGRRHGVKKHDARGRSWDCGVLIPGVRYDLPDGVGSDLLIFKLMDPPAGASPIVERIQEALAARGFLAARQAIGVYDGATEEAVTAFQEAEGLTVDGEVGPETGRALGLGAIWDEAPARDRPALAADPPSESGAIDGEVLTLARTLYGEARGEPREGQEAVANVILNRVRSPRYPNTVSRVCLQRWQFSCWNEGDPNRRVIEALQPGANAVFDALLDLARAAIFGRLPVRVADALHYHADGIMPAWVRNSPAATLVARIGRHLFWRGIR